MFDAKLRPFIDPPLNAFGKALAKMGVHANHVTVFSLIAGLGAALAIYYGEYTIALLCVIVSRLGDGLDGAVARATQKTAFGGYLDIVSDFIFYVSVPLAFGFSNPEYLPYAFVLVASFTLTGVSFLAFASIAAEKRIETTAHGEKSFFYSTGIAEGGETVIAFILMCLLPAHFILIASLFATMCFLTVAQRTLSAYFIFQEN